MTNDEIAAILQMGASEDEVSELLRQQKRHEARADATRGRDYRGDGPGYRVANPLGAISDMFVRGNEEKAAMKAGSDAMNKQFNTAQTTMKDLANTLTGKGLGGVDLRADPTQSQIAGSKPMPMPPAPQLGAPPPAGPMGPPGPGAPGAAPAAPVVPPPPPKPPVPPPMHTPLPTHEGWNDVPSLPGEPPRHSPGAPGTPPKQDMGIQDFLSWLLRGGK